MAEGSARAPINIDPPPGGFDKAGARQLLAADFGDHHNLEMPEDVNADGNVSSVDALMIINRLGRESLRADSAAT